MKSKKSFKAHAWAGFAAAVLSFASIDADAAELARTSPNLQADFRAVAESNLLVFGPVGQVDVQNARVQVLGQWISFPPSDASQSLEGLVGHVFAVYGSIAADGSIEVETIHEQSSIDNVAGATHLYLKGLVSQLDTLHGTARIGSLAVNYSNALHTLVADDLAVGVVASFRGFQFAGTNVLFADAGLVHIASATLGQTGSGKALGQTGSGYSVLGQTGSGKALGQTGSGYSVLGQTGSGKALGQTGSGYSVLGQTGSGKALGQTGSGYSMLGQTGSGKALGQTGSGYSMLGQTGSGKALGQTGSGYSMLGQTGSGKALGQTGSGYSVLGQTGSGKALGQTGSGYSMLGQTGSGKALGQTGSGYSMLGQTGSGKEALSRAGSN